MSFLAAIQAATQESERIYEESLKHGYVDTSNSVVVLTGAAGSGKTHTKQVISNQPPPPVRNSTALAENAIRALTFSKMNPGDDQWHPVDEDRNTEILAGAMAAELPQDEDYQAQLEPDHIDIDQVASSTRVTKTSPGVEASTNCISSPSTTSANPSTQREQLLLGSTSQVDMKTEELVSKKSSDVKQSHSLKKQYVQSIKQVRHNQCSRSYDMIYLFDTGGQPSFHELLPLFFPTIMVVIFVLKLSEMLSHHPKVKYYRKGKIVGTPYRSPLSHLEIAQHSFRAVQSQMLTQRHSEEALPKMIIVGTHRDEEWTCREVRKEKNRKLKEFLSPLFQQHLVYYSAEGEELIFGLNAKHPDKQDRETARGLRLAVSKATETIKRKRTPLSWHVLEQQLHQLAAQIGRGILTRLECLAEAAKLHISERVFDVALDHFNHLNTILYYRTALPHVVFVEPQPLLDKITELIQKAHELRGQVLKKSVQVDGKWLQFRDQGIVTPDILDSFPAHYLPNVFSRNDLVSIFQHKLIISPIDETTFFMPSLLPKLEADELSSHRVLPTSPIAPLAIQFPGDLAPTGLFCSLVATILSPHPPPQLHLLKSSSDPHRMECVARNCIKFSLPDNTPGCLTLIDAYSHFELHLHSPTSQLCLSLKEKVLSSIKAASTVLHYNGPGSTNWLPL